MLHKAGTDAYAIADCTKKLEIWMRFPELDPPTPNADIAVLFIDSEWASIVQLKPPEYRGMIQNIELLVEIGNRCLPKYYTSLLVRPALLLTITSFI